jgi:DNA-binding NarL/FixJ family response regulator
MERVRIALYASDPITTAGIAAHLRECRDYVLLPKAQQGDADVLVVAADHLTRETMATMSEAADRMVPPRIVLIIDELRQNDVKTVIKYGVVSVLSRHHLGGKELLATVASAAGGTERSSSALFTGLLEQLERVQRDVLRPKGLTEPLLAPRERDVLRLLADGHDTVSIANQLSYSERTVKNIVQAILTRLELRNRAHAVAYAMRVGVI